jgi:hypothetical protein
MAASTMPSGDSVTDRTDRRVSASRRARLGGAIVGLAPAVLLAGFFYHPYLSRPTDEGVIAAAAASDPTRWELAHLLVAVGYSLLALAFLAIRSYLRDAGENRWSALALPPIILGNTLFVVLTGMEITLGAVGETNGDLEAVQAALFPWFVPVLLIGGVCFALGAFGFARGIVRSGVLGRRASWLVGGALVGMAVARFVPLSAAPYVIAVAGVVSLWPLAYRMRNHRVAQPAA